MKYLFLCLTLLSTTLSYSQKLKLRKGQKFTYEFLTANTEINTTEFKQFNFSSYQFDVLSAKKEVYNIQMRLTRQMKYDSFNKRISDTNFPMEAPDNIIFLTSRILTKSPFTFSIDTSGKILSIYGLDSIATTVLRQAEKETLPENYYGSKNSDFVKYGTANDVFEPLIRLAFSRKNIAKSDSTFYLQQKDKTNDTVRVKRETIIHGNSGVTRFAFKDSLAYGASLDRSKNHFDVDSWWFALKSSNVATLDPSTDILAKFSDYVSLQEYYTPEKKVLRAVEDLAQWYGDSKGKLGIEKIAERKLDSLSKLLKPDEPEFSAAAIEVFKYFDYQHTLDLVEKTPIEYLLTDASVANKALIEYNHRNTTQFINALKTMFTKFAQNGDYPLNADHIANMVNLKICKDVFESSDRAGILKIQQMVKGAMELNIPKLSSIFDGIAPYIEAKLASTAQEVELVANHRFSSAFDNYGRYRLLIYDRMTDLNVADSIRSAYLDYSIEMFRNSIDEISNSADSALKEGFFFKYHVAPNRILLQKQLADAYYRKSKLQPNNFSKYMQLASDYMPNQEDKIEDNSRLNNEYPFLPEQNYTELYLNAAGATGASPEALLKRYVDMVILEPERYPILKEKYLKVFPNGDFKAFFTKTLQEKLPATPKFNLKDRLGSDVNSKNQEGKFMFVDFWGTWCGACVAEIDKIEDLFVNNPVPNKLIVTTIACYDKKKLVDEFMGIKNFTYQVLMSDDLVEKNFKVRSYPTKLLLLPNDHFLIIPHSDDYKAIVKKYTVWEL